MKNDDGWRDEGKITKVTDQGGDYWEILVGSSGFGFAKSYGVEPKIGDEVSIHTRGYSQIIGLKLNGQLIYDKSEADLEMEDQKQKAEYTLSKISDFEKNREALDRDYASLPEVFQRRIDKFRSNSPAFRWEFEPYEMMCCKQAVLIAEALKTPDAIKAFRQLSFDEQKKLVPGLDGGHSGNSFGATLLLARLYLTNPEEVVKMHGALAPLVGSEEYGCVPRKSK